MYLRIKISQLFEPAMPCGLGDFFKTLEVFSIEH
jgi:hypothetical protein